MFGTKPPALSLFGGNVQSSQQPAQQSTSLFGSNSQPLQQPAQGNSSLFGSSTLAQPQPQQTQGTGLFQNSQPAQQSQSLFGSQPRPQQSGQSNVNTSFGGFGSTPQNQQSIGGLGGSQALSQTRLGGSSLWQSTTNVGPRERSVTDQMAILFEKWNPDHPNCVFKHYFYNNVAPEQVPYYRPGPGEDEKKWEEALSNKPSPGSIPILASGFPALAQRLRTQVLAVQALQARLHEINDSLVEMMQNHDLVISVRTADAKRKHTALSQRCLNLATKVQVLRNRGYVMDAAEEDLKKKLVQLEHAVCNPVFSGRSEEIWARMMGLRERARILQEDSERTAKATSDQQESAIDEEILKKTKQILNDYDAQLIHLKSELEKIHVDFESWKASTSVDDGSKVS